MKKSDLKTGMRVRLRNGDLCLVLKNCETECYGYQKLFFAKFGYGFLIGDHYDEDLNHRTTKAYDIVEIFSTETSTKTGLCDCNILNKNSLKSIWKREIKYSYDGFINGDFSVCCRTEQDSYLFLAFLAGKGITWIKGEKLFTDPPDEFEEDTCFSYQLYNKTLTYGNMKDFKPIVYFEKSML